MHVAKRLIWLRKWTGGFFKRDKASKVTRAATGHEAAISRSIMRRPNSELAPIATLMAPSANQVLRPPR